MTLEWGMDSIYSFVCFIYYFLCVCLFVCLFVLLLNVPECIPSKPVLLVFYSLLGRLTNGYVKSYEPCGPMTAELSPLRLDASQMQVIFHHFV